MGSPSDKHHQLAVKYAGQRLKKKGVNKKMKYKFVAIDLDDTLLADDLTISPQTIEAIQEAVKKGVFITLATGRMYQSAVKFAREIHLDVPIITYQGAYVKNVQSEEILYQRLMPYEISKEIISTLKEKKKVVQIYLNDELYVEKDHPYIHKYSQISRVPYRTVENLIAAMEESGTTPMKIITIDEPEEIERMLETFKPHYQDQLHITISKPHFLEFSHPEATKGQAIQYLAERIGITLDEVIAIGDSYNDLDMIQIAGLGVAMENGHPDIKAIANYITKTNNDHGVWEVLQKFILKGE